MYGSLFMRDAYMSKEPCKRDYILQKRPIILRSPLIIATPYHPTLQCVYQEWDRIAGAQSQRPLHFFPCTNWLQETCVLSCHFLEAPCWTSVYVYICEYVYIYVHILICICIYIYRERERARTRERVNAKYVPSCHFLEAPYSTSIYTYMCMNKNMCMMAHMLLSRTSQRPTVQQVHIYIHMYIYICIYI